MEAESCVWPSTSRTGLVQQLQSQPLCWQDLQGAGACVAVLWECSAGPAQQPCMRPSRQQVPQHAGESPSGAAAAATTACPTLTAAGTGANSSPAARPTARIRRGIRLTPECYSKTVRRARCDRGRTCRGKIVFPQNQAETGASARWWSPLSPQ